MPLNKRDRKIEYSNLFFLTFAKRQRDYSHDMEELNTGKTRLNESKEEFEQFFQESYSVLYYYALRYIPNPEICKDIVSESFYYMWQRIDTFRADTALTYMYTHVHNLCIDYLRYTERKNAHINSYLHMLREWNSEEQKESENRIKTIMKLIEEMPPQTRRIMEQCYVDKKHYKEVAEEEGLSESGVRKHIMRGLDTIRNYFFVKYKKRQ